MKKEEINNMRRDETLKRNASIYRRFLKGVSKDDLAEKVWIGQKARYKYYFLLKRHEIVAI